MASKGRILYIGVTGFLTKRVLQHKAGEIDGFTKHYHVNRLVYFEVFRYVNNAIARETELKWRREKKIALIESLNPTWDGRGLGQTGYADYAKAGVVRRHGFLPLQNRFLPSVGMTRG